jgi:hypothetical protein
VINKINQIDKLWKKEIHDSSDTSHVEEVWEIERSYFSYWCCGPRYKQRGGKKKDIDDTLTTLIQPERLDSEEYAKYDALVKHPSPMGELDSITKRERKKGKNCVIY